MNLTLRRRFKCNGYTIGTLYIDNAPFCDTLEDADRGLDANMSLAELQRMKLKSVTAIPTGSYSVTLKVKSPRFGSKAFYKEVCGGFLPRLVGVPAFDGVLIHCGNTAKDTDGCILVGENKVKGQVVNSQATFRKLYARMSEAAARGEAITIGIR